MSATICRLTLGISTWAWLCAKCIERRMDEGWLVEKKLTKDRKLDCDLCHFEASKKAA